jgi:nitrate/nitrite transporter NarK
MYIIVTFLTGVMVWFSLKAYSTQSSNHSLNNFTAHLFSNIKKIIRIPAIWWQTIIVLCAYVGYKGIDHLSLYAVDAYQYNAIEAAKLVTIAAWIRPVVAILAGIIAVRIDPVKMLILSFIVLLVTDLTFAFSTHQFHLTWILIANTIITCTAVFALRALYFSVFEHY